MNPKIARLLSEGISINTLESLNNTQLNVLYERVKKETKEETTTTIKKYNLGDKTDKDKFLDASKTVTDKNKINFDPTTDTATVGEMEMTEKAVSRKQQRAMAMALKAKQGEMPKSKLKGSSKEMFKMSEKDLKDFASTKHKGLPKKKETKENEDVKNLEESIMRLVEKHLYPEVTKKDLLNIVNKR
jgi:hypothetical protein